ncbi:Brp/Blh family beta-carotene 15,15'-dioxygenase [Nonlabens spongiae]|nr:Brp/Blh family beta-carotene 15,15'-dioxygenase [Nonlabens spongiae]
MNYQLVIFLNLFLILSIGILHGSNDLVIYKKVTGVKWKYLIINYVLVGLLFFAAYFISPFICVLLFVLVSAYHFGEELYESDGLSFSWIHKLSLGLLIFLMMFVLNAAEFDIVLFDLTGTENSSILLISLTIASGLLYLIYLGATLLKKQVSVKVAVSQIINLAFMALLFYGLNLFTSFTVFFVFWHSLPSLSSQMKRLYKENKTWLKYVKDAAPIYMISLLGIAIGYVLTYNQTYFYHFALLIAIIVTVPHIIIIHKLYGDKQAT